MYRLLVLNFLIKLYALRNIFEFISEKYGQAATKLARKIEKNRTKLKKIRCDIRFLTTCKRNKLIPTFAKPKIAIKINRSIENKIASTIIETEIRNKQKKQNRLVKELLHDTKELKLLIGYVSYCTINHVINKTINGKRKEWKRVHERKLTKLFDDVKQTPNIHQTPRNTVSNFSSYTLTAEESYILSFGLDHHVETKLNPNTIKTEFESMYHHLDQQFANISSHERDTLKTKIRRTCENYINIPSKTKYEETISKLSKNKRIVILRQDKGKGVVLINRSKYIEKCLSQLETPNFTKLTSDPTITIETKVQNVLKEIKKDIGKETYDKIYPSGSNPGKFYGTAKIHKLSEDDEKSMMNVDKLPLRQIVSNISTAT